MASQRDALLLGALAGAVALLAGCSTPYQARHEIGWDARDQIWLSEASQVQVRAAQSRVLDTADRRATLEAVITTFQDLGFVVEVLDEELGIVSGKKYVDLERSSDPYYFLYEPEDLVVFTRAYRTWGPFQHRSDLVRLTVTVRRRSPSQLVVRAAAQFYLRPIEEPEPYQKFFRALEQALFAERQRAGADRP